MRRVLVADDDAVARRLLALTLEGGGLEILTAADGPAALRLARRLRPSLVFLDWEMPGTSGLDVCRALRAEGTAAPAVVMVTARAGEDDLRAALRAGADAYLIKPFSPLEVLDKVVEVLGADAVR